MRFFREPLMVLGKRRSPGVIELMIAIWRRNCCSLACIFEGGRIHVARHRQLVEHGADPAHVHHLLELFLEVRKVEAPALS